MRPALAGLTAFSLTCLVLGSAVYAVCVPGLVASSNVISAANPAPSNPAIASQRLMTSVMAQLLGASDGEEPADAEDGGGASGVSVGGVAIGNLASLGSSIDATLHDAADAEDAMSDDQEDGSQEAESSDHGDGPRDDDPQEPQPNPEPEPEPDPEPDPGPDPEEEERIHALLVEYAGKFNGEAGYLARIEACGAAFSGDSPLCLSPSLEDRRRESERCAALAVDLSQEFARLLNTVVDNDSQWLEAKTNLIAMYRTLAEYAEAVSAGWTRNLACGEDPSSQVDYFMEPVIAAQESLVEFNEYAARLEL